MVLSSFGMVALLLASSAVSAALAIGAAGWLGTARAIKGDAADPAREGTVFLFDSDTLVDATKAGERLLSAAPREGSDWARLVSLLSLEFPDLGERLNALSSEHVLQLSSRDTTTQLTAEFLEGLKRISLVDEGSAPAAANIDAHSLAALERELEVLRTNTDLAPALVWRQRADGEVTWFNRSYRDALQRLRGRNAADNWPVANLFGNAAVEKASASQASLRTSLEDAGVHNWFDIHAYSVGDEFLCSAASVDRLVAAEDQLRSFTQTLTKTFADLDAGLAIFDRRRRLVMFNPALCDVSGLQPGFLASRPSLFGVLDRMRDVGRVPEPRNYSEWRQQVTELESEAADGYFSETWTLLSGETLRVTGRPHPDGAVAFILEDISAEVTLTRRFRSEVEVSQAVLDTMERAVAVFGPSGDLTLTNRAYMDLWGHDPGTRLARTSASDLLEAWKARCMPDTDWAAMADQLALGRERTENTFSLRLLDGRSIVCLFGLLPGGSTLVSFRLGGEMPQTVPFRRRA